MKAFLKEPLVHFLLGGLALFALYAWTGGGRARAPERIVIDEAQVRELAASFERTWQREPTQAELDGLIADRVRDEILYREALALELDRNDVVIRRRLRQKMEFLGEDLVDVRTPGDDELQAWLDAHADAFEVPATVSFRQVYLDPKRSKIPVERRAAELLERLRADSGAEPVAEGDPTLLPAAQNEVTMQRVTGVFGGEFAERLAVLPVGEWTGPIRSTFGAHLVSIDAKTPAAVPDLAEVRPRVEREWAGERRREANEAIYRKLRERYDVEIRKPTEDGP